MYERHLGRQKSIEQIAAQKLKNAMTLEGSGRYESALMSVEEALNIYPNYVDAWLIKGVINGKLGKFEEAIKCYDKAIEFSPRCIDAYRLKSATLSTLGLHDKVIECLCYALEKDPSNYDMRLNLASAYQRLMRYEEAFQCYLQAKSQNPNDPKIDYLIGVMWGNKAEYEKALASFDLALGLRPDYIDALLGKGLMLAKLGKNEEAKACANQLLELKGALGSQETSNNRTTFNSSSQNDEIRNQYLAAQKRFTSQYAPNKT